MFCVHKLTCFMIAHIFKTNICLDYYSLTTDGIVLRYYDMIDIDIYL